MKKLLSGATLMLAFVLAASAQPGRLGERAQDKIQAYKIAFFTERLQLTPDESKAFWPLYDQYEKERDAIKDKYDLENTRIELMPDNEVEALIMKHIDAEEQQAKLRRDYVRRFKEVLPIRKVAILQRMDVEFKRALLEELKKRRENRQGGGMKQRGN